MLSDLLPAANESTAASASERPIDLVHLARTTLGDRALEREILHLFDRQADALIARMRTAPMGGIAPLAHTLKGSATGIGAWRVARAAEALEIAVGAGESALAPALDRLATATAEARAVIAELLKAN
jgi:HPt (histidine-containing phosphotransfer) domain-containing protein